MESSDSMAASAVEEKKRPRLRGGNIVLSLFVALLVLHLVAMGVNGRKAIGNDDFVPDRSAYVTAVEYADLSGGFGSAPASLVLQYETATSDVPVVRLIRSYRDDYTRKWVQFDVQLRDYVSSLQIAYEDVEWVTGASPSIQFTFGGEPVEIYELGSGYNYWRFITFRGAERYAFVNDVGSSSKSYYGMTGFLQEHVVKVQVTIPNERSWLKAKDAG